MSEHSFSGLTNDGDRCNESDGQTLTHTIRKPIDWTIAQGQMGRLICSETGNSIFSSVDGPFVVRPYYDPAYQGRQCTDQN